MSLNTESPPDKLKLKTSDRLSTFEYKNICDIQITDAIIEVDEKPLKLSNNLIMTSSMIDLK